MTDKSVLEVVNPQDLTHLCRQIFEAQRDFPNLKHKLILSHGAGSYGHPMAKKYGTRKGVIIKETSKSTEPEQEKQLAKNWLGFTRVGDSVARLNRIIVEALLKANVPAFSVSPMQGE